MTEKKTTAKSTKSTQSKQTISKKEYDEMAKRLKEMEAMFAQFQANQANNGSMQPSNIQYITNVSEDNRDIVLTSLTVGELNLSTEGYGQGIVYTFHNFGEEISIPYSDLKKIIRNNKNFIEGGNVFINDDSVIESQRLTNVYKKLLSYDEIMKIFTEDKKTFANILKTMTQNQKETLKGIIFDKLNEDADDVDMNIVQLLNDDMDTDIMAEFKSEKELFKEIGR